MKMVKSLLLGTAAGLVAVAGAQAADLPVKAKPVQYVRICSLYGVGFYYIPGTDTCIKIGGFVRAEVNVNANGSFSSKAESDGASIDARDWQNTYMRARGGFSMDARSQTGYGTLRAYFNAGITSNDSNGGYGNSSGTHEVWRNRAFIQWAGFTFGLTDSFFDFDTMGYSNQSNALGSSASGSGVIAFAYTAQFGNGFSGTLSAESAQPRRAGILNYAGTTFVGASQGYGGLQWPDIVGNLRVDQGWGSAQLMGAIHQVRANYWLCQSCSSLSTAGGTVGSGHPSDEIGYAVGAGLKLNLPMLGHGDYAIAQVTYAHGANRYVYQGLGGNVDISSGNGTLGDPYVQAFGPNYDATYGFDSSGHVSGLDLTDTWGFSAGYEHHWNSMWKSSIYGAYAETNYSQTSSSRIFGDFSAGSLPNADWSMYQIGSRTVWTPVKNLDFSLEVMYTKVDGATDPDANAATICDNTGAAYCTYGSVDWWSGIFRVQRNFYP